MTDVYIREYARQARDADGNVMPAGEEPAIASQTVNFTTTSTQSAVFNKQTSFIRVWATGNVWLDFGTAPTAAAGDIPIEAASPEYFGLDFGKAGTLKVAAVDR